jgi:hypothetical protein
MMAAESMTEQSVTTMTGYEEAVREINDLREMLADAYIELSGKKIHTSDCATSRAPAQTPGKCDCTWPQGDR